jgi:hypothetical protein
VASGRDKTTVLRCSERRKLSATRRRRGKTETQSFAGRGLRADELAKTIQTGHRRASFGPE